MINQYFFEDEIKLGREAQNTCFEFVLVTSETKIMLWHFRLWHPNFQYLKHLFPKLFITKDSSLFHCEICELAKHHHAFFPSQPYKASKLFSIIHSDVWGPSRVSTFLRKKLFIIFINDHPRVSWVCLLKEKLEVTRVFKFFHKMVKTQFQTNI